MSDRLISGDTSVEALITDLLQDQGICRRGDARLAAEDLTAPTEVILGAPPATELPDHFEASVSDGLERLATQYEEFPREWPITSLETEILGLIGLGLEGKLSGPRTVLPHISQTSSHRSAIAPALAETRLPTESVSSLTIDGTELSPESLAYYDAIMDAVDRPIPEPAAMELARNLHDQLDDLEAEWSNRDELRALIDEHLRSILRSHGLANTEIEPLVEPIAERAESFYDGAST